MGKIKVHISASAGIAFALAILVLPLRWVLAAMLAGMFHELCHILAIYACKGKIGSLTIGSSGAKLDVTGLNDKKELLCAIAGPLGGFALLFLAQYIPRIAVCAAFQSLYNLLPIYPLDGGRAIRCLSILLFPTLGEGIFRYIETVCKIGIACISIYACFWLHLGLFPILCAFAVVFRKSPCKESSLRLQ